MNLNMVGMWMQLLVQHWKYNYIQTWNPIVTLMWMQILVQMWKQM